jgi:hypothetical protein
MYKKIKLIKEDGILGGSQRKRMPKKRTRNKKKEIYYNFFFSPSLLSLSNTNPTALAMPSCTGTIGSYPNLVLAFLHE